MPLTFLQYITPSRLAGAEHFFLSVISHLAQKGHRVIVVTKRDTPLRAEIEKLDDSNIELHAWHTRGKIDPKTLFKLCRLIRRERVDVINTHLTTASWMGALAGRICGVPSVAVVHATDRKTWFQHADHLIAVSQGVKDALVEQNLDAEKIKVLYHGINLDNYAAPLETAVAKARLGLPADARTVGVTASLIERKGHRFLLRALKNLEATSGPVHAIFAGEGELGAELRAQAGELGLAERVHFLGFRRDVAAVVSAMDVFVLPSLKEGLSLAVMEAMALQKPVVCSAIAGLPEVVRDGQTGVLVPPGDVAALTGALEKLLGDAELRRDLGCHARQFLHRNFEQTACLEAMEAHFTCVVAHHQAANWPTVPPVAPAFAARRVAPVATEALRVVQLISPSKIAGAERLTISLCRGLNENGHQVSLLVKPDHALIQTACAEGVDATSMRLAGKLNLLAVGRLARWFYSHDVDIVATQLSTASLWGTLAARLIGLPSVATVHALNSKTCYLFADRIIAVSHAVKAHLIAQGVEAEKIRVVHNGIDLHPFVPPADKAAAKSAVGLPAASSVVGVVAHLTQKKGHRWFLDAAAPLLRQFPDLQLLFLGEGDERAALQKQARALGVEARVIFAGFHAEVVPFLAAMDVLVLPPIAKEGFGRVLVEAGAMGLPVVGTDIGGIGEVIVPDETGFVVAPGDADALQLALSALLDDAELREKMGARGRERAWQEFSAASMIEQTERVYRELLAERAPCVCDPDAAATTCRPR